MIFFVFFLSFIYLCIDEIIVCNKLCYMTIYFISEINNTLLLTKNNIT